MKQLDTIESIYNVLNAGVFIDTVKNGLKNPLKMEFPSFIKHLIFGKGYREMTPPQLTRRLENSQKDTLVIDLREKAEFKTRHIQNAVSHPFDDFIKDILINNGYADFKDRSIILVCDTGIKSKVSASILADEGFSKVSSLKRGMWRWNRWVNLMSYCNNCRNKKFNLCRHFS